MKKAFLYLLLLAGVSLAMILGGVFFYGLVTNSPWFGRLGITKGDTLVYNMLLWYVLWAVGLGWLFIHNRWASFSLGNLRGSRLWACLLLSSLVSLSGEVLSFVVRNGLEPPTETYLATMQLYQSHPFMTLAILVVMYCVGQLVLLGAVLRQLAVSMRRQWLALLLVSLLTAWVQLQDWPYGISVFLFATLLGMFQGWLYLRTRSIWPAVAGGVVADYLLWMLLGYAPAAWLALVALVVLPLSLYALWRLLR